MDWIPLPAVDDHWAERRLQAHWLAQPAAAFGIAHVPHADDDSHTSLTWDARRRWMVGQPTADGTRIALAFEGLSLQRLQDDRPVDAFVAAGRTLAEAHAWVDGQRPDYEMPDHPLAHGAPFAEGCATALADAYSDAALVLGDEPLRLWPHHFDLARLIEIDDERTIGIGFSPGDDEDPGGYFYVRAYPEPDSPSVPDLPHGHWRRDSWFGAVLCLSALRTIEGQQEAARLFLDRAIGISRGLL